MSKYYPIKSFFEKLKNLNQLVNKNNSPAGHLQVPSACIVAVS
jgi:hypothetical protein